MADVKNMLLNLVALGCYPALSWRGNCWRAHINMSGNYWSDADDPVAALTHAYALWLKAGKPKDGMADQPPREG